MTSLLLRYHIPQLYFVCNHLIFHLTNNKIKAYVSKVTSTQYVNFSTEPRPSVAASSYAQERSSGTESSASYIEYSWNASCSALHG